MATGYTGTVSLTSSDPSAVLPPYYTFTAADAGQHSFAVTLDTAGTQSITVTDTGTSSLTAIDSAIAVQAAAAKTLTIAGLPTIVTAGTVYDATVTARDAYGNVATGYTGTVSLTSSDSHAVLPPNYTFTTGDAGQHTFAVTLDTFGTQSISATDTATLNLTATDSNITVKAAAATTLRITGFPTSDTAGTDGNVTVTAYDAFGNVATAYTGTVALTSSDPQAVLPPYYTFTAADAGQHSFGVTLDMSGTQSITATDIATSNLTATESGIAVQAATAKTLTIAGLPTTVTAGTVYGVTITARDAYGNVATGYTGTVSLTTSDPHAVMPPSYTFTDDDAGQHSFGVAFDTSGTQSITATDTATSNLTGTESNISVKPGTATTLKVTGFPKSDTAGTAGSVTVTAYDAFGNVATSYTGTVSLSSSDPHAVLPSYYTFTAADAGQHSFAVTLDTAGTQSITVTDNGTSSLSATVSSILVQAAAAQVLSVTGLPSTEMAAVASQVTVTAYDSYGNVATGYSGTIAFSSSDAQALLPPNYSFVAADAGSHTFSFTLETAGTQSITTTDKATASITGTESGIAVRATPRITWSNPASIVYGMALGSAQLDASANVPGTFAYAPAAGAILNAGSGATLSVTFTPSDTTDYTTSAATTTITVTKAAPILTLTSSGSSAVYGQPVSFIAAVESIVGAPSGTVTFYDGITPLATVAVDGSGMAALTTPALSPGSHSITATYNGDADFKGAQTAPYSETVTQTGTEVVVVQNPLIESEKRTSVRPKSVRLTVDINAWAPGGGVPTGEVTFELLKKTKEKVRVTTLATAPVSGGEAMLTLSRSKVLKKAIRIVYSGDADDKASTVTTARLT